MTMQINKAALDLVQQEVAKRDGKARLLGMARIELLEACKKAAAEHTGAEFLMRVGAAHVEYAQLEANAMEFIRASGMLESALMEAELRKMLGEEFDKNTYTVDRTTGDVLILKNGQYLPVLSASLSLVK